MRWSSTTEIKGRGLNVAITRLLYSGLIASLVLLLAGVLLAAVGDGPAVPRFTSFGDMPSALVRLEAGGFFSLGLLVLLLTPAAQVILLLVAFLRGKNWVFAGLSLVILAVLVLSAILGLGG